MEKIRTEPPVRAVIFDLGRVLIDVNFSRGLFRHLAGGDDSDDAELLQQMFADELFVAFSTGRLQPQELHRRIMQKYSIQLDYQGFCQEWCNIFSPLQGMENLLQQVAGKLPVGLLSDTDPLHWQYCLQNFPWLQKISRPTLSFEIGALKPARICYARAADNLATAAENCLFIDDKEENVLGARQAGMQAVRFRDVHQLEAFLKEREII